MSSDDKPWWYPIRTDAALVARLRRDYPGDTKDLDDAEVLGHFGYDCWDFVMTWDNLSDAKDQFSELAKHFLDQEVELYKLKAVQYDISGIGGTGTGSIKALSIIQDLHKKVEELRISLEQLKAAKNPSLPFRIQFLDDDPAIVLVFEGKSESYISEPIPLQENDDIVKLACEYAAKFNWFNNPPVD